MLDELAPFKPLALLVVLLLTTCAGISRAAEYQYFPQDSYLEPIQYNWDILWQPPEASAAHKRECVGESETYSGYLQIDDTNQIDVYRCVRWVKNTVGSSGTFKLKAVDDRFHQVGFPYLTWVSKHLIIDGQGSLDEAYFPRLSWVGGDLIFDMRSAVEYVDTPSLTTANKLKVYFRTNNVDLNGQNSLQELDYLTLSNNLTEEFPLLNGLDNLQYLGGYKIEGGDVINPDTNNDAADGGFLESLNVIDGSVIIETHNMSRLYGLGNVHTINGNLKIHNPNYESSLLEDLVGLNKVNTINGSLIIDKNESLISLNGLGSLSLNSLVITDNPSLANVSALQNVTVNNYGSVTFENLNSAACPGLQSFIASLNNTVNVNNMMNCQ